MTVLAAVDEPAEGQSCSRAVLVSGWAVSTAGAAVRAEARVDGAPPVPLHRGRPRPDVEAVHPAGGPHAGYSGLVPVPAGGPAITLDVVLTDDRGTPVHVRRILARDPAIEPPAASTEVADALAAWLCRPTDRADPFPRATIGAVQLHGALDLASSFPDLRGPDRFAYFEWLYRLWKKEGDDAVPLPLVAAVWLSSRD